jgi:hypothetical protein
MESSTVGADRVTLEWAETRRGECGMMRLEVLRSKEHRFPFAAARPGFVVVMPPFSTGLTRQKSTIFSGY